MRAKVHCESCNIDFTVNFDRSVELTFRPNPAIRATPESTFCVGGPQVTPHIVAQQLLRPGERARRHAGARAGGRYRLRAMDLPGGQFLVAGARAARPRPTLAASRDGWPGDEPVLAPRATLTLENATDREQLLHPGAHWPGATRPPPPPR